MNHWIWPFAMIALAALDNWRRGRLRYRYTLRPNCLVTRSPIVFVTGRKSLFYFARYWNFIPDFLRDHGYEVREVRLPWRDPTLRRQTLERCLQTETPRPVHLIADATSREEVAWVARRHPNAVASASIVMDRTPENSNTSGLTFIQIVKPLKARTNTLSAARWALWIHRQLIPQGHQWTPTVLGVPGTADLSALGGQYLNLAISLAESELE